MKTAKFLVILLISTLFAACGGSGDDNFYGDSGNDYDGNTPGSTDNDVEHVDRPDDAQKPGGGGSSGGIGGGSTGNQDEDEEPDGDSADSGDSSDSGEPTDTGDSGDSSDSGGPADTGDSGDSEPSDTGDSEPSDTGDSGGDFPVYESDPNIAQCTAGYPSEGTKNIVLERLNYLRAIHKLPPVVYTDEFDDIVAECSLVIAANQKLSHYPDSSWKCYSQDALDGCSSSNIHIMMANYQAETDDAKIVDGFMIEKNVDELGHRRWFLDPWLADISYGRSEGVGAGQYGAETFTLGAAVHVIGGAQQDISDSDIEFVAYPFENYPKELYDDSVMMSFTVISNKFSKWSNSAVDFSSASIAITSETENKVYQIKDLQFDNDGYGVPNNLRWRTTGVRTGLKYNVVIHNVIINNYSQDYIYWFQLD